jgi:hypothetical protein
MRVRLADDFFRKEREQNYSDWRLSVWRELFQNSIDQDADEIRIGLQAADDHVLLTFADDGPGMSREVLENVYFAIGATTKTGANQIGGMGRARVLTCFAMQWYQVRSQDYIVDGRGGEYEVTDASPYLRGCELTIAVDDASYEQMVERLDQFLVESRISARVYLNGTRLYRRSALPGRHVRDLLVDDETFARVYVNKSVHSHRVIVRVNGVSMFTTRTSSNAQIVVELEPSLSRQVLTANRDGLRGDYRYVLNDFLREIAVDTRSALRDRYVRHTTVAYGGGSRRISRPKPPAKPSASPIEAPRYRSPAGLEYTADEIRYSTIVSLDQCELVSAAEDRDTRQDEGHVGHIVARGEQEQSSVRLDKWLADTFGDIYVYDETTNTYVRRNIAKYVPQNWQTVCVDGKTFRKGGNIIRVLLMWQAAIDYALEIALEPLGLDNIDCNVGFVFSDDNAAEHRQIGNAHVFALCPVNRDGKLDYAVTNRKSLKRLMTYAKHEVAHVAHSWHSEDFSRLRETIDQQFYEVECLRRMKAALDGLPEFEDERRWAA